MLAELEIVYVRRIAVLEYEDEFMLRPIETALACSGFDPNDKVFKLGIHLVTSDQHLAGVPPIDTNEVNRTTDRMLGSE